MITVPPPNIVEVARQVAQISPCRKSTRGAAIFVPGHEDKGPLGVGYNSQPAMLGTCNGDEACRKDCGKICVHAEQRAITDALMRANPRKLAQLAAELVHVKVVGGEVVAGGPPSCWQCSKAILDAGIAAVWLFEERPTVHWQRYTALKFHEATLKHEGLYPYTKHGLRIVGNEVWCSCGFSGRNDADLVRHMAVMLATELK